MRKYKKTDDAMHIAIPKKGREIAFEWWYFDASFDNGDHFVTMYNINDPRLSPRQPSIRTNIYENNGNEKAEIKKYEISELTVSYDRCNVKMGEEFCIDHGDHYELYTKINGTGAHLKYYPCNPPWTRPPSILPMGWTVAIPFGTVEGVLFKDNREIQVKGTGYHDHNWGTRSIDNYFKHWYWGKIHTNDFSIDYSILISRRGEKAMPAILITDHEGVIFEPSMKNSLFNVKVKLGDVKIEPDLGFKFANRLEIEVKKKNYRLLIQSEIDHFVMKQAASFKPSHSGYRYIGNETITEERNGIKKTYNTHSLQEVVFIVK